MRQFLAILAAVFGLAGGAGAADPVLGAPIAIVFKTAGGDTVLFPSAIPGTGAYGIVAPTACRGKDFTVKGLYSNPAPIQVIDIQGECRRTVGGMSQVCAGDITIDPENPAYASEFTGQVGCKDTLNPTGVTPVAVWWPKTTNGTPTDPNWGAWTLLVAFGD